jgi:two-component system, cell cycle response regulator
VPFRQSRYRRYVPETERTAPGGGGPASEKPKILVVDDEPANLDLVVRMLRKRYEVRTAPSGDEGLELLRRERFAAILSDQRMPGMTGTQFLAEARSLVPDTVRMILTGYTAEADSLDAINRAHVACFLTKPIAPEALERAIADAVELYQLTLRNQQLLLELAEQNQRLEEAKRLLEMSLDERTRDLLEANRRLESLALRDSLTGLYNHRFFQERLAEEIARVKRYGGRVSLVLADIDRFRQFNERYGHPVGDKLLVGLARVLSGTTRANDVIARIRPTDMVARFGGEEFVIIVPETTKAGAAIMCQRIRETLRGAEPESIGVPPDATVTLSFGVAEAPTDAAAKLGLLEAAETALVRAKQGGRDRIELY